MKTILLSEQQRSQNQADFVEYLLNSKRLTRKAMKNRFQSDEVQDAIKRLRNRKINSAT